MASIKEMVREQHRDISRRTIRELKQAIQRKNEAIEEAIQIFKFINSTVDAYCRVMRLREKGKLERKRNTILFMGFFS